MIPRAILAGVLACGRFNNAVLVEGERPDKYGTQSDSNHSTVEPW